MNDTIEAALQNLELAALNYSGVIESEKESAGEKASEILKNAAVRYCRVKEFYKDA